MHKIYLYNTLSRKKELFIPIKKKKVGLYTCGPTVYDYAHLGNLRTYLFEDFLKRVLLYNNYSLYHVSNVTDVGHLVGDQDMGEDKVEVGAKREGKTAQEIVDYYFQAFLLDLAQLNIIEPNYWAKATADIPAQIKLIKTLEKKGFTYTTSDGVYFNTAKIKDYNKLSHLPLEQLKEGARVEINQEKINATDFALWKFSTAPGLRQMEWPSPWGLGFPGWHLECSALSLKYLKPNLDIHCGGVDHINIHHTNEIAQSEAATGKKFFNYWLHGAFLVLAKGEKMSKSKGGFITLASALDTTKVNPLAFRLLVAQAHYRKELEFSLASLKQADQALNHYYQQVISLGREIGEVDRKWQTQFREAINNDLNIPQALALLSKLLKSSLSQPDKLATVLDFDKVLGLKLGNPKLPAEIIIKKISGQGLDDVSKKQLGKEAESLLERREELRQQQDWIGSDSIRQQLEALGWQVKDSATEQILIKQDNEKED